MRRPHQLVLLASIVLAARPYLFGMQAQSSIARASFVLDQPEVVLHQPVVVIFSVQNLSKLPLTFDLGGNHLGAFSFVITPPTGTTVQITNNDVLRGEGVGLHRAGDLLVVNEPIMEIGKVILNAGETYTQRLIMNKWYGFPLSGQYRMLLRTQATLRLQTGQSQTIAPTTVSVRVANRDADRLTRAAAELAHHVTSGSYESRLQAAQELGYMHDPAAVASLRDVLLLADPTLRRPASRALGVIGTQEAADALLQVLPTADAESRREITSALTNVAHTTSDSILRERIQGVLAANPIPRR